MTIGIAFGFLVSAYLNDTGKNVTDRNYSIVNEKQEGKYLISEHELRAIISDVVRNELRAQLQHQEKMKDAQGIYKQRFMIEIICSVCDIADG